MPSFPEVLYNLPAERLQKLVHNRNAHSKKLALVPNKKQLVQVLSAELNNPASVSEAIMRCDARELRLLQILVGLDHSSALTWETLLEAGGGLDVEKPLLSVVMGLEEKGLVFPIWTTRSNLARSDREPEKPIVAPENRLGAEKRHLEQTSMPFAIFMPDIVRQFIPASLSDRFTLIGCLEMYDAPSVKRICDQLGLPQDTKVKNIHAIRSYFLEARGSLQLKNPLTQTERDVLEYLVQTGGSATAVEVANATLEGKTEDFFRYDWQNRWKSGKERNAVDSLLARGLVYVVSYGYGYNLFLVIPGDLLRALTQAGDVEFWNAPPVAPTLCSSDVALRPQQHNALLRDVVAVLGFITSQDAIRTNTGYIHKTSLKNMMRGLSLPEERYASFLYAICRSAGLISPQGERSVYRVTDQGIDWLYKEPMDQIRLLVAGWRRGILWGEMYNDALHKNNEYRGSEGVFRIREAALDIVTETSGAGKDSDQKDSDQKDSDQKDLDQKDLDQKDLDQKDLKGNYSKNTVHYYTIDSVVETLAYRYPLYLVGTDTLGSDLVPSPANFIRNLIVECLYWLGLVELVSPVGDAGLLSTGNGTAEDRTGAALASTGGRSPQSGLIGFRVLDEGRFLLDVPGIDPPESTPREDKFIIQANGEIFVSPYLELSTLFTLLAMTETPAKGGTGNTVVLSRESIRRALDQGEKPAEILAFLQSHSRTGIPQNVEYLIKDVGTRHGHIHIGKAVMYIQVDTPLLLKELKARKDMQRYWVRELGETVALLNAEDPDKLLRDLRKAGYLPVSDDAPTHGMLHLTARRTSKSSLARSANQQSAPSSESEARLEAKSEVKSEIKSEVKSEIKSEVKSEIKSEVKKGTTKRERGDTVDWDRIAQEDGKSYSEVPLTKQIEMQIKAGGAVHGSVKMATSQMPKIAAQRIQSTSVATEPALLKVLLGEAVRRHGVVEAVLLSSENRSIETHRLYPSTFEEGHLVAWDETTGQEEFFTLDQITRARMTGEQFL